MNNEVEAFEGELAKLRHENKMYLQLIKSLLNPDGFGLAVSAEVRDEARKCLGITPCEQNLYR